MPVLNVYKVIYYHQDDSTKKRGSVDLNDYVQAAAGDEDTLRAVLVANGRVLNGRTIRFQSISNAYPANALGVLS